MGKPACPERGSTDKVIRTDGGQYACTRCDEIFDKNGNKYKK